jgi:hypothetical protein
VTLGNFLLGRVRMQWEVGGNRQAEGIPRGPQGVQGGRAPPPPPPEVAALLALFLCLRAYFSYYLEFGGVYEGFYERIQSQMREYSLSSLRQRKKALASDSFTTASCASHTKCQRSRL